MPLQHLDTADGVTKGNTASDNYTTAISDGFENGWLNFPQFAKAG